MAHYRRAQARYQESPFDPNWDADLAGALRDTQRALEIAGQNPKTKDINQLKSWIVNQIKLEELNEGEGEGGGIPPPAIPDANQDQDDEEGEANGEEPEDAHAIFAELGIGIGEDSEVAVFPKGDNLKPPIRVTSIFPSDSDPQEGKNVLKPKKTPVVAMGKAKAKAK